MLSGDFELNENSRPTTASCWLDRLRATTRSNFCALCDATPRGYFIKSWAEGKLADTIGTIETSTVAKDAKPADEATVPLAVDPNGRSAIMTGPIDATGEAGGVWELSAEPKAQLPPKHLYVKQLPKGSSRNFIVLDNNSILIPAAEEGAVDFRRVADGDIQTRIVLGKFSIGGMKRSSDRKWLGTSGSRRRLLPPKSFCWASRTSG